MALDGIGGSLNSSYLDYVFSEYSATQTNKLTQTLQSISSTSTSSAEEIDDELMDACKDFEAYFLEQIWKEMYKSVELINSSDDDSSDSSVDSLVSYFRENTFSDIASQTAETSSVGLAQMLYENMKQNYASLSADQIVATQANE